MLRPQSAPLWQALLGSREAAIFAGLFVLISIPQTILLTVLPLQAHDLLGRASLVSILYFGIGIFGLLGRLSYPDADPSAAATMGLYDRGRFSDCRRCVLCIAIRFRHW